MIHKPGEHQQSNDWGEKIATLEYEMLKVGAEHTHCIFCLLDACVLMAAHLLHKAHIGTTQEAVDVFAVNVEKIMQGMNHHEHSSHAKH